MSYYDRFNSDGRLKPLEQIKEETRSVKQSQDQASTLKSLFNLFKSILS